MKITYYLKGHDKPYVYEGNLKQWEKKVHQILGSLTSWAVEEKDIKKLMQFAECYKLKEV